MKDEHWGVKEGDLVIGLWFNNPDWVGGVLISNGEELAFTHPDYPNSSFSTEWAYDLQRVLEKAQIEGMSQSDIEMTIRLLEDEKNGQ